MSKTRLTLNYFIGQRFHSAKKRDFRLNQRHNVARCIHVQR